MRAIDENTITNAALEQMEGTPNPRLKEIVAILVRQLHAFAGDGALASHPGALCPRKLEVELQARQTFHRAAS